LIISKYHIKKEKASECISYDRGKSKLTEVAIIIQYDKRKLIGYSIDVLNQNLEKVV